LLLGCESGGFDSAETFTSPDYDERTVPLGTANSGPDGIASFTVDIRQGDNGFSVFATAGDLVSIEQVRDPSGNIATRWEDWYYDPIDLTDAFYPYYQNVMFTWPMRAEDGELEPGDWTVEVASTNANWDYKANVDVTASARIRSDGDPDNGIVRVVLVFAEGVEEEPGVREAVDGAIARWREVWGPAGLTLELREVNSSFDAQLEPPWDPATDTSGAAALAEDGEVVVFLGELLNGNRTWYGVSGGIPGPLEVTDRSATLVSWLAHAGINAEFDADEIGLFGETLAHEVGHYVGLQHPVQSDYSRWDALGDTPECTNATTCESQLGENLMFPYSICSGGSCVDTYIITNDQLGEMQRAAAAR
jgi:hypothetical protein